MRDDEEEANKIPLHPADQVISRAENHPAGIKRQQESNLDATVAVDADDGSDSSSEPSPLNDENGNDRIMVNCFEQSLDLLSSPLIRSANMQVYTDGRRFAPPRRNKNESLDNAHDMINGEFQELKRFQSLDYGTVYGSSRTGDQKNELLKDAYKAMHEEKTRRQSQRTNSSQLNNKAPKKANFWQCVFNMCNALMGIGLLALPFSIACAGWIGGILVLLLVSLVTWWTCILIGRSLNGDARPTHLFDGNAAVNRNKMRHSLTSWSQMAQDAFGPWGNIIMSSILYFELFSAFCVLIVTMGDHLHSLYPTLYSQSTFMIITSALLTVPTTLLRTPRLLSYMSVVGTFSTIAVASSVVLSAVLWKEHEADRSRQSMEGESVASVVYDSWIPKGVAVSVGLVAFCCSGHVIIPSFFESMERPQDFEKMVSLSYILVVFCYLAVAVSGYYMFGANVQDQITLSLEQSTVLSSGYMAALTWLMVLTAFSKSSLYIFPLSVGIEEVIAPQLSGKISMATISSLIKIALIAVALAVAIFVPSFGFICALVGIIFTMVVSVIFPAAAHYKLFGHWLSWTESLIDWTIVIAGVVVAIVGTIATVSTLRQQDA